MTEIKTQDDRATAPPSVEDEQAIDEITAETAGGPIKPTDAWPKDEPIKPTDAWPKDEPIKPTDAWPKDEPAQASE